MRMKLRILSALLCLPLLPGMATAASTVGPAEDPAAMEAPEIEETEEPVLAESPEKVLEDLENTEEGTMEISIEASQALDDIPDEITIYAVDTALENELSVPDSFPQSYSLAGHSWEILDGESIEINEAGTVAIVQTTWYYHTVEGGWTVGSTTPSGDADEISRREYSFGDSVILVDGSHQLTVHAVSYAQYYAEKVMNDYLIANVAPGMAQYEVAELCCRFVAEGYDYSVDASSYTGMIVTGGGDCWASTSALLYMLNRQGITCSSRDASADTGAGGRHMNVMAELDGGYYILEAGYTGSAPRGYSIARLEASSIFTYSTRGGATASITGLVLDSGIAELIIPEEIDGYTITAIADGAFSCNHNLVSVTMPDTVTYLGSKAFFQNYTLESITLSEQLATIGSNCFAWDDALKEINIPASVTNIDGNVFCYCDELSAINVDPANSVYCSEDGVLYDKAMENLLIFPAGKGERRPTSYSPSEYLSGLKKAYTVPDGVKAIEGWAFAGVDLAEVKFPNTLEDIRSRAFYNSCICTLEIPEGMTFISPEAFYDTDFSTIRLPATLRRIESKAFCGAGIPSLELPEGLEYVGDSAFSGILSLYIRVPASVKEIGAGAFCFSKGWSSMGGTDTEKTGYEGAIVFDKDCDPVAIGENAFGREVLCVYPDSAMYRYAQENNQFWYPLNDDGKIELQQEWLKGFDNSAAVYTGMPATPSLEWESSSKGVCPFRISSAAYNVAYTNNINIGTGVATITGKGFFTGTVTAAFQIRPADPEADVIDRSRCGLQYKVEDSQAKIVSYIANALPRHVIIPETLDGYPVTEISDLAFEGRRLSQVPEKPALDLASVVIPASVTEIGYNAFSYYEQVDENTFKYTLPADLIIYAQKGSYAETYARDRGIFFVPITSQTDPADPPEPTTAPTARPTTAPTTAPTARPTAVPTQAPTGTPYLVGDLTCSGGAYYFYENGEMAASKEAFVNGAWRWFDMDGTMAMDKDVYQTSSGGKWVRYNEDGEMVKGEDYRYGGWYYFDEVTGAMVKGPMTLEDGRQVYYDTVTGQMLKGEQSIGGRIYYFDEADGHLASGETSRFWVEIDGKDYWYEDWRKQGWNSADPSYRGKEIYDPTTDAWYWLDNIQQGAKAFSKDVYQESYSAYPDREDGTGKWVRYDENGRMVKGWQTTEAGTYYFETITGSMAKGQVTIDGVSYYFDQVTGIRQDE